MAPEPKIKKTLPSLHTFAVDNVEDDDDFQDPVQPLPLIPTTLIRTSDINNCNHSPEIPSSGSKSATQPLKPYNTTVAINRPSKKPKQQPISAGKENLGMAASFLVLNTQPPHFQSSSDLSRVETAGCCFVTDDDKYNYASARESTHQGRQIFAPALDLDSIESTTINGSHKVNIGGTRHSHETETEYPGDCSPARTTAGSTLTEKMVPKLKGGFNYLSNSIESRLLKSTVNCGLHICGYDDKWDDDKSEEFESGSQLDVLLRLCTEVDGQVNNSDTAEFHHCTEFGFNDGPISCPLCGVDISDLSAELRQVHTNECLDKEDTPNDVVLPHVDTGLQCPGQVLDGSPDRSPRQVVDVSPVLVWLRSLGLAKYEELFVQEEIGWDCLQWLTEEDLFSIGVTALGPRKKIIHALSVLKKEGIKAVEIHTDACKVVVDENGKLAVNKLITDYFPGFVADRKKGCTTSRGRNEVERRHSDSGRKHGVVKNHATNGKFRDIPLWCCIPGTPFRVDAFKYLRRDCFHWFLTHFHIDHYQGLTRSFCHGKIYCSLITAKLVNLKIGIPWDKLQVLPLNRKICIAGIDVTCFDANHCPGSIIILFEPPNSKAVLHTGDFRFSEEMARISILQTCPVHTLILDTTYCDPQYDFPKQEAVIQFVIEAIQAEAFNPKTLFLIGSYTIGKERLFVEVARVLRKKVYVNAAKLSLLECLGLPKEDMQWFTLNEQESHIHVVPMWTLASFKRLKHISNQYMGRFSLVVAFSPTGWTFGKGKKKCPGRRWQQGTIIRYEVPYSEHCSFTELREFVKFVSPVNIIPSVNNQGPQSTSMMVSLLVS